MRQISPADEAIIVKLIRNWDGGRLTWEAISAAAWEQCAPRERPFARQSLSKNEVIKYAYVRANEGDAKPRAAVPDADELTKKIADLEAENQELKGRYEQLLHRHRHLMFNASLLPGGVQLIAEPLPDNTRSQGGGKLRATNSQ